MSQISPPTRRGRPSNKTKDSAVKSIGLGTRNTISPASSESSKTVVTALGNGVRLSQAGDIRLFQMCTDAAQQKTVDPAMTPIDGSKLELREFDVQVGLAKSDLIKGAEYWGVVASGFKSRMGFGGAELKAFIQKKPGYDVYFCNPNPQVEALHENLWLQGNLYHPDFLKLSQSFLVAAGFESNQIAKLMPSKLMATGNYFVGNNKFWAHFLKYLINTMQTAQQNLPAEVWQELRSSKADARNLHGGASYLYFIAERLLTEFIQANAGQIKAIKLRSALLESSMNKHLKNLRALRDLAASQQNQELLEIWTGYRDAYLQLKK